MVQIYFQNFFDQAFTSVNKNFLFHIKSFLVKIILFLHAHKLQSSKIVSVTCHKYVYMCVTFDSYPVNILYIQKVCRKEGKLHFETLV